MPPLPPAVSPSIDPAGAQAGLFICSERKPRLLGQGEGCSVADANRGVTVLA